MQPQHPNDNAVNTPLPPAFPAWWLGFDYVFGYQIKLVQDFWGLSRGGK